LRIWADARLTLWSLTHPGKKAYFWDVVAAMRKDPAGYRHDLRAESQLLGGKIRPVIGKVIPLKEASKAQQMVLDYEAAGKLVLPSD